MALLAVQSDHAVCQTLWLISSVFNPSPPGKPFLGFFTSGFLSVQDRSQELGYLKGQAISDNR